MADDTTINTTQADESDAHVYDGDETVLNDDIAEGSALGLIGGAIIGGLAGGPVGIVVGAVIGGIASAFGVAEVDRHNHEATVASEDAISEDITEFAIPSTPVALETVTPVILTPHTDTVIIPQSDTIFTHENIIEAGVPNNSAIRLRAYQLYELRGREDGKALQDWLNAESEYASAAA